MKIRYLLLAGAVFWWPFAVVNPAFAQGTAFTYQGRLNDGGNPANGSYDLTFTLYATNTTGTASAGPLTNSAVTVTNGLFAAALDFGPGVFDGAARWLEIGVRTNGGTGFTTLTPRQPFPPAPYAIMANTASNLLGTVPLTQLPGAVLTNNGSGVTLNGSFIGNGAGLTNIGLASLVPSVATQLASAVTNGVWLIYGASKVFYGTNAAAACAAINATAAGNTVQIGAGNYDFGNVGHTFTNSNFSIQGAGCGRWVSGMGAGFTSGTIFSNANFGFNGSNIVFADFGFEHPSGETAFSIFSSGITLNNIGIGCTDTNTYLTEALYLSGRDFNLFRVQMFDEPGHGYILKGVTNATLTDCTYSTASNILTAYEGLIIKADTSAQGNVQHVRISNMNFDTYASAYGFQMEYISSVSDVVIQGGIINHIGPDGNQPISFHTASDTNAVLNDVQITGLTIKGNWNYMVLFCAYPSTNTFGNTLCANWVCTDTNICQIFGYAWYVKKLGQNHFNNIIVNNTAYSGVDQNYSNCVFSAAP